MAKALKMIATICQLICTAISAIFFHEMRPHAETATGASEEFSGEYREMDTSSFDKQAKQHLKVYENVMFAAKICIVAIIVTLIIMAATLV